MSIYAKISGVLDNLPLFTYCRTVVIALRQILKNIPYIWRGQESPLAND